MRYNFNGPEAAKLYKRIEMLENGCWLWCGPVDKYGYGKFPIRPQVTASRFSYMLHHGDIPKGLVVDHMCRTRLCVNPDHLRLLTPKANVLCGEGITAKQKLQTHCKNGHPFSGPNLWINPKTNQRVCRECHRVSNRINSIRRYREKRGITGNTNR